MTDRPIPQHIQRQARRAITAIEAWNDAILAARCREVLSGHAGYWEHKIRVDRAHIPIRLGASRGAHALDLAEAAVRALGQAPQALYQALRLERPQVLPEGPHVVDWFEGQR